MFHTGGREGKATSLYRRNEPTDASGSTKGNPAVEDKNSLSCKGDARNPEGAGQCSGSDPEAASPQSEPRLASGTNMRRTPADPPWSQRQNRERGNPKHSWTGRRGGSRTDVLSRIHDLADHLRQHVRDSLKSCNAALLLIRVLVDATVHHLACNL